MKNLKKIVISVLVWLIVAGGAYYVLIPAINIHSTGFWSYLIIFCLVPAALLLILNSFISKDKATRKIGANILGGCVVIVILAFIAVLSGSTILHSKAYSQILKIDDYDFTEDIDEATAISNIALMDSESAQILGNREIGSLSDVVSQFNVENDYSQIDLNGTPKKVSALGYAGFFKYMGNKQNGVPGYVKVDPVEQNAEYVKLENVMKYIPSSYFNKDLARHLQFNYPTKIIGNIHFEVDEKGNPYYIASTYNYTIALFGGETISGAIICDPITGDCEYYNVGDVPEWVDVVFSGNLLTKQYNWYGTLSNGFFNSVIGKKGCKRCTETVNSYDEQDGEVTSSDYGYIAKDGDIWLYTGVTSVNDDASNIGFIMINQRTSEAHYFNIAGADESSAMASAQGEVQEKGYIASFPSLINVDGQPTYILVLKDASGIVKLYAMVNVEQYNIVTTASTIDECFSNYKKRINGATEEDIDDQENGNAQNITVPDEEDEDVNAETVEKTFEVASIQYVDIDGNTYVYLTAKDGSIYKQKFADNEKLVLINNGDKIKADCIDKGEGIFKIVNMK